MPDLSEYRVIPPRPNDLSAVLMGSTVMVHMAPECEHRVVHADDPSLSDLLTLATHHEVFAHSRVRAEPEVDEPCCYGYIRTNGRGAHEVDCPALVSHFDPKRRSAP